MRRKEKTLDRFISVFGVAVIVGIAWLLSNNKKKINWRLVGAGLALQWVFALIILRTAPGKALFEFARVAVAKLLSFTDYGAAFLFNNLYLGLPDVAASLGRSGPYGLINMATGEAEPIGVIFAFHILTTIIFFSSLMAVLYHLGIMQRIVKFFAWIMQKTLGTSGAETLSASANIFVGQTEAPLVIRPYIGKMTQSELMVVMVGGFATVAGGVLAAYVRFGIDAGHLLAASVMSAPAALVLAKIMIPEVETPATAGGAELSVEKTSVNVIDAAADGAAQGLKLALNVGAMLLAFLALVAMINFFLGYAHTSLQQILGFIFAPLAWCMGVPKEDAIAVGGMLGTKISVTEFIAYMELGRLRDTLSDRSVVIATYALCGFANLGSIGIQIGGISGIAPERRGDLARIGLKAMFCGALASFMTAAIAGTMIG